MDAITIHNALDTEAYVVLSLDAPCYVTIQPTRAAANAQAIGTTEQNPRAMITALTIPPRGGLEMVEDGTLLDYNVFDEKGGLVEWGGTGPT